MPFPSMDQPRCANKDVIVKPLADTALCFETYVVMRANEDSRLVNEFVRSYLRKYTPHRLGLTRMELNLPARFAPSEQLGQPPDPELPTCKSLDQCSDRNA
jgi:hypothetical protein